LLNLQVLVLVFVWQFFPLVFDFAVERCGFVASAAAQEERGVVVVPTFVVASFDFVLLNEKVYYKIIMECGKKIQYFYNFKCFITWNLSSIHSSMVSMLVPIQYRFHNSQIQSGTDLMLHWVSHIYYYVHKVYILHHLFLYD